MATRTTEEPRALAAPGAPRQWVCEEQPSLRLYLRGISPRPRFREMGLPDESYGAYRKGDHFVPYEHWAQFVGGKYVTADPAEQEELARIEREGIAPIYEDAAAAGVYVCRLHNFTTTSPQAFAAHQRAQHKNAVPPALYDAASDDLGQEQETPY